MDKQNAIKIMILDNLIGWECPKCGARDGSKDSGNSFEVDCHKCSQVLYVDRKNAEVLS